jgi:hypothetical protein
VGIAHLNHVLLVGGAHPANQRRGCVPVAG